MVKKGILILVLASLVAGGVFAQNSVLNGSFDLNSGQTKQKGVLFVDLGYTLSYLLADGFGIGAGWEQDIDKNWTWLINGGIGLYGENYYSTKYEAFDLSGEFNVRYYLLGSALDKLFLNGGVGFTYYSWSYGSPYDKTYAWGAITVPLYAGWKVILGPGFVLELDIGYRLAFGIIKPKDYYDWGRSPTMGGLLAGLRLGWAF